jgi:hypothetical protein
LEDFYYRILEYLFELYSRGNETHVIKYMTKDFYKINRWENYNKKQELAHMQSLEPI